MLPSRNRRVGFNPIALTQESRERRRSFEHFQIQVEHFQIQETVNHEMPDSSKNYFSRVHSRYT